jgi:hypothetical protein
MIDFSDIDLNEIDIDVQTPDDDHMAISVHADGLGTFALRWRKTDAYKAWSDDDDADEEDRPALPDDVVAARDHIDLALQLVYERARRELRAEAKEHGCAERAEEKDYRGKPAGREWCRVGELEESFALGNRYTELYIHVPAERARLWAHRLRGWLADADAKLSA